MNFKTIALAVLAAVTLTACSDDSNAGTDATIGGPKIRVVNSAYKAQSSTSVIAMPIDYMIDSAATGTSSTDVLPTVFDDVPVNSIAGLTAASTTASSTLNSQYFVASTSSTGFQEFDVGVHSYVAREADSTLVGKTIQLYTNNSNAPYLPRQYLTAGTYYTFIVAGMVPTGNFVSSSFTFTALVDDPFWPPQLSDGTYQARFRVINAAPFNVTTGTGSSSGTGGTVRVYVTPSSEGEPTSGTIGGYTNLATASFRNASPYINVTGGTYYLTITDNGGTSIRWSGLITLAAGEVRTFILQNNISSAGSTSIATSSANFKMTNILDQQY